MTAQRPARGSRPGLAPDQAATLHPQGALLSGDWLLAGSESWDRRDAAGASLLHPGTRQHVGRRLCTSCMKHTGERKNERDPSARRAEWGRRRQAGGEGGRGAAGCITAAARLARSAAPSTLPRRATRHPGGPRGGRPAARPPPAGRPPAARWQPFRFQPPAWASPRYLSQPTLSACLPA